MSSSIVPESELEDVMRPSAEIIPFPARPQPALTDIQPVDTQPVGTQPADLRPEDRLARALASLNAAMAEQKAALAAWRGALGALQASTSGLGDSLQRYHTSLGTLGGQVAVLHDQAVTMERWADDVLAE